MHINQMPLYIMIGAILALSVTSSATPANDPVPISGTIKELNDSTVNSTIAQYPFLVLNFHKQGCNPCQRMRDALINLSSELGGQVAFGMINMNENNLTAQRYNITSSPTLLVFENGTSVDRKEGFASKRYIVDNLRRLKPDLDISRVT